MTLSMPDIDIDRMKNFVHSVAYLIIAIMVATVLFEALVLKTFNLALLEGLTALMQLF